MRGIRRWRRRGARFISFHAPQRTDKLGNGRQSASGHATTNTGVVAHDFSFDAAFLFGAFSFPPALGMRPPPPPDPPRPATMKGGDGGGARDSRERTLCGRQRNVVKGPLFLRTGRAQPERHLAGDSPRYSSSCFWIAWRGSRLALKSPFLAGWLTHTRWRWRGALNWAPNWALAAFFCSSLLLPVGMGK